MIHLHFQRIAEELEADYLYEEFARGNVGIYGGKHYLNVPYKGQLIQIMFDLCEFDVAEASTVLFPETETFEFEIEPRGQLARLLFKRKCGWTIKCIDEEMRIGIENQIISSKLDQLIDQTRFEPFITGKFEKFGYKIHTKYSLAFNNKEESVLPMINFYKGMIDFLANS